MNETEQIKKMIAETKDREGLACIFLGAGVKILLNLRMHQVKIMNVFSQVLLRLDEVRKG